LTKQTNGPMVEELEYEGRYYTESAKSAIESAIQILEEAISNEDEAIRERADRDGGPNQGEIVVAYDPDHKELIVTGDGVGMTSERMRKRLRTVGGDPEAGAKRSYFNRGIRDVFLAMGGGEVTSVGKNSAGEEVLSRCTFLIDDTGKMVMRTDVADAPPSDLDREQLGFEGTGTQVRIPVRRLAKSRPKQFQFGELERQIRDCVGLRPVMSDPARQITLAYADTPPRRLQFEYPEAEDLVLEKEVEVAGVRGTLWAKLTPKVIKQARSRRAWISGILVRGERSAYEIARDSRLAKFPAMERVIGELRIDEIEILQREADEDAQLLYKTDRSGLNVEHPVVEAAYDLLVAELEPLIANLDANQPETKTSADVRRDLQKLAREINSVIDGAIGVGPESTEAEPAPDPDLEPGEPVPDGPEEPPNRELEQPIAFPVSYAMAYAGESKSIKVWFASDLIPPGSPVEITSASNEYVSAATLSADQVPPPAADGVAELSVRVTGGSSEGRYELCIRSGEHKAMLPVHVRFRRASGFISSIVLADEDWPSGSAIWDPSSGVVSVKVGRPEFKQVALRAAQNGHKDPFKDPLYRQLVVESVREAALWEAAKQKAEVEWDELPAEDRRDGRTFQRETQFIFQEFDYKLRVKLHKAFARG
jgi:hypothetical protein